MINNKQTVTIRALDLKFLIIIIKEYVVKILRRMRKVKYVFGILKLVKKCELCVFSKLLTH